MNRYDKESIVIEDFQDINSTKINPIHRDLKTLSVLDSIHSKRKWKKWIDTSSKKELPPDFYNPSSKLMMDVMRIDDHTHVDDKGNIVNPHNKRESEILEEMISKNPYVKDAAEKGHVFIVPRTNLPTDEDHNYNFYIDCFKRVINKHINKIKKYRENHPGYKVIFFILDEASPYIKCFDEVRIKRVGDSIFAQPHYWWLDSNMVSCFKDTEIDYVIWMTPFKHFDSDEKVELPEATVYNVKKINCKDLIDYKPEEMQSLEL